MFSFFGGITAAYVFLDLLPRFEISRMHLERLIGEIPAFLENLAIPGLAFVGFLLFFILEHFAIKSKHKTGIDKEKSDENISNYSFGVHFAIIAF
jgi:hypothetical protein